MREHIVSIVIMLVCLGFSAFFSSTETAYTSFNRAKMKNLAAEGNKKAARALKISESEACEVLSSKGRAGLRSVGQRAILEYLRQNGSADCDGG